MAIIPYAGILPISLQTRYTLPAALPTGLAWHCNSRNAQVGIFYSNRCDIFLCEPGGAIRIRVGGTTGGSTAMWGAVASRGLGLQTSTPVERYIAMCMGSNLNHAFYSWAFTFQAGLGADVQFDRPVFTNRYAGNVTNDNNEIEIGWNGARTHGIQMRCNGLNASTPKTQWRGGPSAVEVTGIPINLGVVEMLQRYAYSGAGDAGTQMGGTVGYGSGWRRFNASSTGGNRKSVLTVQGTTVTLDTNPQFGADPNNTNTPWVANLQQAVGGIRAIGNFGWIVRVNGATPVFPGMQDRLVYVSKSLDAWYAVQCIGLDANALARINTVQFSLGMSEDGYWMGKSTEINANSRSVLSSPVPPIQILPKLVPWAGLPEYGVYDKPYGVNR